MVGRHRQFKGGGVMKKLIFILIILAMGCAPINKYEKHDTETKIEQEPLKFSNDPLLDSIYRDRYLKSLKNLSEED